MTNTNPDSNWLAFLRSYLARVEAFAQQPCCLFSRFTRNWQICGPNVMRSALNFWSTVLAVSNCVGHDGTSYAVLKHIEVEFGRGTSSCDTGTQCSVHWINVKTAHFGAKMLKRNPPGGWAMPNRTERWLFEGIKVDEIGWNFHGTIWTQRQTFSSGIHPPGPPALWASMQKPCVWVERLLGSVKQQKESERVTLGQVNKTRQWHSGHLLPTIFPSCCSVTWSHRCERRQSRSWLFRSSLARVRDGKGRPDQTQ